MVAFLRKTDVQGILFFASALFVSASLTSYHPLDPSLNSLGQEPVQNYCGYVGAFLSDLLFQGFGLVSWVIVLFFIKHSFISFSGRKNILKTTLVVDGLFLMALCSFISLLLPEARFFQNQIFAGGILGQMAASGLLPVFHKAGAFIVLTALLTCCFILQTHKPLRVYAKMGMDLASAISFSFKKIFLNLYHLALRLIKKSSSIELPPIVFHQDETPTQIKDKDISFSEPDHHEAVSSSIHDSFEPAHWEKPTHHLLPSPERSASSISSEEIHNQTKKLQDKLAQFAITGKMVGVKSGPAVTLFEFKPADSVKVGKITGLADDLSMALSAESLRIIAPIPGRDVVGIEASNPAREMVYFKDLVKDSFFQSKPWDLPLILGKRADGAIAIEELSQMPHLMVAGSTGSGKSVFVNSALAGLLMHHSPETLKLILIDPKQVDLRVFEKIPHLIFPPVAEVSKALDTLHWTIYEMNKRYRSLNQFHVRGIKSFNHVVSKLGSEEINNHNTEVENAEFGKDYYFKPLPYICVVVEEFGDLMASPKRIQVEQAVVRLAQMARACGIHLILSMQSPRKDVITGLIKTNIPGRISFKVSSKIDSRVILDESGAERLLAKGDMLFLTPSSAKIARCHGSYISEDEISLIVDHWKEQGDPQYQQADTGHYETPASTQFDFNDEDEEKYHVIRSYVSSLKTISTSSLQRKFRLGYPRAARMMEKFEEEGIVGPAQGSKPREVLHQK